MTANGTSDQRGLPLLKQGFDSNVGAIGDSLFFDPREEEMRTFAFLAGVMMATPSMAEQLIFYTASFPDATSVQLSILNNSVSQDGDYEFEVAIGLAETDTSGAVRYEDTGKHRARVRCNYPAYVGVGARKYSMALPLNRSAHDDWKESLWITFCAAPSS